MKTKPITIICIASPYMVDRGRDAADIFTATLGVGVGAKARVGPVQAGLLVNRDTGGMRGGDIDARWVISEEHPVFDCDFLVGGFSNYCPSNSIASSRNKHFTSATICGLSRPYDMTLFRESDPLLHYYTQIELVAAFGPSVRVGFNAGELVDFLLGWFLVDVYKDDVESNDYVKPWTLEKFRKRE